VSTIDTDTINTNIMPILNCPFCGDYLPYVLNEGIVFCDHCERMVDSSYKNKMLSVFRILNKNQGMKYDHIKLEYKLDDKSWEILTKAIEDCLTHQEFEALLKRISSSSSE